MSATVSRRQQYRGPEVVRPWRLISDDLTKLQTSYWTALLLAVHIGFQLRRMRNEEVVLGEIFPEYAAYKAKTARLIPGID